MKSSRIPALVLTGAALLAVPVATANAKSTITMSGSTSVFPLATKLAQGFVKAKPGAAKFKILQGGSDIGIDDVSRGRVSIGNASRDLLPSDPNGLQFNKIARDAVCVITSPKNPIANLSQDQIQAIFTGKVRDWSQVTGAKVSGTIDLISRTPSSGTADAFKNIFLGPSLNVAGNASQKKANGVVQTTVANDDNAIGYVSLDFVAGTHPVSYKGVACNLRNAKSGQYGGVRNFWMVTRGKPSGATAAFLKYATSPAGQKIVATDWVPIH